MDPVLKELEEKYSKNKPTFSYLELLKCIALVVGGCVLFAFMPDEMRIAGWVLFAIGTFLIVVGIFRLASMVPEIKNEQRKKIVTLVSLIAAVFIQFIGLLYLYNSGGTGKGMAITTLTLCISLGLIIYVTDFEDKKEKKKVQIACRIITLILVAIAVLIMVRADFSNVSVYVATILFIEAAVTGKTGFSSNKRGK